MNRHPATEPPIFGRSRLRWFENMAVSQCFSLDELVQVLCVARGGSHLSRR